MNMLKDREETFLLEILANEETSSWWSKRLMLKPVKPDSVASGRSNNKNGIVPFLWYIAHRDFDQELLWNLLLSSRADGLLPIIIIVSAHFSLWNLLLFLSIWPSFLSIAFFHSLFFFSNKWTWFNKGRRIQRKKKQSGQIEFEFFFPSGPSN